jgi:hypothetical protein
LEKIKTIKEKKMDDDFVLHYNDFDGYSISNFDKERGVGRIPQLTCAECDVVDEVIKLEIETIFFPQKMNAPERHVHGLTINEAQEIVDELTAAITKAEEDIRQLDETLQP